MNLSVPLRRDLATRALHYAQSRSLPHSLSYGDSPVVCFAPDNSHHGNFFSASYKAILSNPAWRRRLGKVHTQARRSLPVTARRWMELDTCTSSDALLMNIFCHPTISRGQTLRWLGAATEVVARFGYRARVPLTNGKSDRTEVDLRLGDLLIEAKLTESDFQKTEKKFMAAYRDFEKVFDATALPQTATHYLSYQLLRNVLAAHALQCAFCVLLDARRPDLIESWYAVMKCVQPADLRTALRVLTWQELAQTLPNTLQEFLASKYGIEAAT
jgi:hypothetical protein